MWRANSQQAWEHKPQTLGATKAKSSSNRPTGEERTYKMILQQAMHERGSIGWIPWDDPTRRVGKWTCGLKGWINRLIDNVCLAKSTQMVAKKQRVCIIRWKAGQLNRRRYSCRSTEWSTTTARKLATTNVTSSSVTSFVIIKIAFLRYSLSD